MGMSTMVSGKTKILIDYRMVGRTVFKPRKNMQINGFNNLVIFNDTADFTADFTAVHFQVTSTDTVQIMSTSTKEFLEFIVYYLNFLYYLYNSII